MKIHTFVLFLIVVFSHAAIAQNYYVKNESNPRDGSSVVYMVNNYITPQLQLSAGIVQTRSGNSTHILASHYTGHDRFNAHTMYLYIDGERITVDRIVNRQRNDKNEIVGFEISGDVLRKLGHAQNIRLHLRGNWSIEQDIDQVQIRRFGEFYNTYMR
jgi:hypothetical protein